MEKALLLHIGIGRAPQDDEIQEFKALAVSAGVSVSEELIVKRSKPTQTRFPSLKKERRYCCKTCLQLKNPRLKKMALPEITTRLQSTTT